MKPSQFTEERVIVTLREQEVGAKTTDVCRKHCVGGATAYEWTTKYMTLRSGVMARSQLPEHID